MSDPIKNQLNELKAGIAKWPKDQRGSLMNGIMEGLGIAALIAKQAGCDIVKDPNFEELADFLIPNTPPIRRRNETAKKTKPTRDQLVDDIKELLLRAIAYRLRIPKPKFDTSLELWELVNKNLLMVIAIGNRKAVDEATALKKAVQDIRIIRSVVGGGTVDQETVKSEVEFCCDKFPTEIAAIIRFNEMTKEGGFVFEPKDIWANLRANVPVSYGYDDDNELPEIDARYQ